MPPEPRARFRPPALEASWVETDSYDRARFGELRRDSPSLRSLEERGAVFLPCFGALVQDLFAALYKFNVLYRPEAAVSASARLNRILLDGLLASSAYEHVRDRTRLDEGRAGLATTLLAERALELLMAEKLWTRRDLVDQFELARDEEDLARRAQEIEEADRIAENDALSETSRREVEKMADRLESEARLAERRLQRKAAAAAEDAARRADEARKRLEVEALDVAQSLEDASDDAESFGRALGARSDGRSGAQSLELGRRLARNPKLRKLARLFGRMREQALALRHRLFERPTDEVHEVDRGRDVSRLLPQEMLALHHPVLRLDWRRRFVEGTLLEYQLRGDSERGRGPMIVCLDVSSSMEGDKEIWSKAVALTLLEIARRERRRFRAILFSSAETGLHVLDLNAGDRWRSDLTSVLDLADYFAGGGTDFERPLDAAVECLGASRFRRGDVVLITDGECRVSEEWKLRFLAEKERLDFSLYSVQIDVGSSAVDTLAALSDRISRVSDLTADKVKDLFVRV